MSSREEGMNRLVERARKKNQDRHRRLTETLAQATVDGGRVAATMNGHRSLVDIRIDPEIIKPELAGELEAKVLEVVNAAARRINETLGAPFAWTDTLPSLFDNLLDADGKPKL